MASNEVLIFDIASGGMSAARFNARLEVQGYEEVPWKTPLHAEAVIASFQKLSASVGGNQSIVAMAISSFMHSFLLLDWDGRPQTPVYTWMDDADPSGMETIRSVIGPQFHQRTGCHYHPMFPVFKLKQLPKGYRVASPKTLLIETLCGNYVEDFGMASASGLLNVHSAAWDDGILRAANLSPSNLPQLMEPHAVAGSIHSDTVLVNGSGDGFMANVGSGCQTANRIAITLGTSAAVRQMVSVPALNPEAGTFCYRANGGDGFLLGCASSNGGNALDWARREFGITTGSSPARGDIPIFLPWLNGERSLEWDPDLRPMWHGRRPDHSPEELFRSVLEGVVFNLAQYVEVIEKNSGVRANEIVLSGNGFLDPSVAPVLAALVSRDTLQPEASGLGTLRGTAVCAWRALGHDATPAVEQLVQRAKRIVPVVDDRLRDRYERFKSLRVRGA